MNTSTYERLLLTISENAESLDGQRLSLFGSAKGSRWSGELLICGRAVNGYNNDWSANDIGEAKVRSALTAQVIADRTSAHCSMHWVSEWWNSREEYNTARSAFWRVTRAVTEDLSIASATDASWSSYLAWTNLYRVSPHESGNPSAHLMRLQYPSCVELLASEIADLRPERILFLTGASWAAPFLKELAGYENRSMVGGLVEMTGLLTRPDIERIAVVVAKHPQGKPESAMVGGIVDAFRSLHS